MPALVCPSCKSETPLIDIDLNRDPAPRCGTCFTRFSAFERTPTRTGADASGALVGLVAALAVGDLDAATALLHPAVVWRDPDVGDRVAGVEGVRELLEQHPVSRSVWRASVHDDVAHALIYERAPDLGNGRLVSWLVHVDDGVITSCWVSTHGRDILERLAR
jgi:hypothetical protein